MGEAAEQVPPVPLEPVMGGVAVERMRKRHLRSVLRIERQAYGRGWSLGLFLSELSRPDDRVYLVAIAGSEVVGFAGVLLVAGEGHVTNVAVERRWQRRSVATRLVLGLARHAIAMGAEGLTLEVRPSNKAGLALYRRFGMSPVGVRPDYYKDPPEDALIMWATDVASQEYGARLDEVERSLEEGTT